MLKPGYVLRTVCFGLLLCVPTLSTHSQSRAIASGGTTTPQAAPMGSTIDGQVEFDSALMKDSHDSTQGAGFATVNRKVNEGHGHGDRAEDKREREDHAAVMANFDGLNLHDQRFANHGNQFSIEPPDQGLCAGNGFILESVNDVMRVFDTNGVPQIGVVDLNTFYGYPAAVNRTSHLYGQDITDPSCYFDTPTQRWFHVVLTLDRAAPTGPGLNGKNHLDLAVSDTASPLGSWTIYRLPVQDDGTDGTPNHGCILDPVANTTGPCLGDYPHIGADSNGIYLTTNEFSLFGPGFIGAQIYAISKHALVTHAASIPVFQYNTGDVSFPSATGLPGFSVIPAISPSAGEGEGEGDSTEYLLSSTAVFTNTGVDSQVQLWALTDSSNLNHGKAPILLNNSVPTESYGVPNPARQPGVGTNGIGLKPGGGNIDWPLGQCLNDLTCAPILLGGPDPFTEVISSLDGDDSRMKQVYYVDGKVWGALGTGISFDGKTFGSDGVAYFIIKPKTTDTSLTAKVVNQGYVATPKADLTYPTFGVTGDAKSIISFTVTGPTDFPSLGYVHINEEKGAGDIHIAAHGAGPQDGFTGYKGEVGDPTRPRWGDYGATAVVGNEIFAAQEYIGQSCTLAEYRTSAPFGTCNATRAALGNWGTRIMRLATDGDED